MQSEIYIEDEIYYRLVDALLNVEAPPFLDRPSHIKLTLGEIANVWPANLRQDGDEA